MCTLINRLERSVTWCRTDLLDEDAPVNVRVCLRLTPVLLHDLLEDAVFSRHLRVNTRIKYFEKSCLITRDT